MRPIQVTHEAEVIGSVLSERYRLLHIIGDGGMGRVYAAEHVTLRRKLAIKVLKPELGQVEANVERFLQEARAASMIAHPNVVDILDFGRIPGGPVFFVMEFLEGEDLANLLRRQPRLPWPRAQQIALQVVRGLHAAHKCGVIHRDMKPANIFLVRRPDHGEHVKLLDFGIAKLMRPDGRTSITGQGSVFGTARYMSPEQASGLPVDGRSDVYAVGILLYEMLTGRVPFEGDNFMRVATQHINEPIRPLREVAPDAGISEIVDDLVMRALAKRPDDRYPSMAEFEAAILGASFESTVAIHNPLAGGDLDRTAIYDTRGGPPPEDRGGARVVNVDATVVRPHPRRSSPSAPQRRTTVIASSAPRVPVVPMSAPPPMVAMVPAQPEYYPQPPVGLHTGEHFSPVFPAGLDRPSSEPVEQRTLPPLNWSGGNPSTAENMRGGEGAETHEFALHVPRREVSRNWLVITVSIVVLALIWGGGVAWYVFFFDDEEEAAPEVHPTVVKDEPRPIVVPDATPKTTIPEPAPVLTKPPEPEPTREPPVAREAPPRHHDVPEVLGDRDLARGFAKAKGAIEACGRQHGAIGGTGFTVTFDVADGRATNVAAQRPQNITALGRCVAAAVQDKARFTKARTPSSGVTRRVHF